MAKVNFDDVWNGVSSSDFLNIEPENEYDLKVVTRKIELLKDGFDMLNGPLPLTPEQRNELLTKIRQLQRKLLEESILVNRVDPRVSVYRRNPLNRCSLFDLLNLE